MKIRFIFLLLPAFILLQGCVKILNDDLTTKETKLVLNAAVVPDSIFEVNISRTFNIFEDESINNLPFVNDATVKLFVDGNYLFNLENIGAGYYRKDGFFPETGKTYKVTAERQGYKNISSTTTIPGKVNIIKFDTVTINTSGDYYSDQLNGLLTFRDPVETEDYYMLSAQVLYPPGVYYDAVWSDLGLSAPEGLEKLYENSYGKLLWTDRYSNGKEVTLQFVFYGKFDAVTGGGPEPFESDTIFFRFYLQHITKDYFNYALSYYTYRDNGGNDPFSEPVVIYSNVENGYGILGSYNQDTAMFALPFIIEGKKGGSQ